jgi:hypothetical protein
LTLVGVLGAGSPLDLLEDWVLPEIVTVKLAIGEPKALAAGDFDGDGLPDLFLITDANRPDVLFGVPNPDYEVRFYLLRGQEAGGWAEPILVTTLPAPGSFLYMSSISPAVDIDGDGNVDLAVVLTFFPIVQRPAVFDVANRQTDLVVFWGQGTTFQVEQTADLEVGMLPPTGIVSGDFNGDGLTDLAYPDPQNLTVHVLYNLGGRRLSEPHIVPVGQEGDECIPLPTALRATSLAETSKGDAIVVAGPCVFGQDDLGQFIRTLISCGDGCWELSSLVLTGLRTGDLTEALADFIVADFNGDGHTDLLLSQALFLERQEGEPLPPAAMGLYLLSGDGRGGFGPPVFVGGMARGGLLFAERDPDAGWEVIALSAKTDKVIVLRTTANGSRTATTSIPVRGYVVDGAVLDRPGSREIVVISSLDLESEVTLLNVVTRRSP